MKNKILEMVQKTNQNRSHKNLIRRILKLSEEMGEVAEAYLNVTSKDNGKEKTWDDVREELVDVLVVVCDVVLTPMPDQEDLTPEEIEEIIQNVLAAKLGKWKRKMDSSSSSTDEE